MLIDVEIFEKLYILKNDKLDSREKHFGYTYENSIKMIDFESPRIFL